MLFTVRFSFQTPTHANTKMTESANALDCRLFCNNIHRPKSLILGQDYKWIFTSSRFCSRFTDVRSLCLRIPLTLRFIIILNFFCRNNRPWPGTHGSNTANLLFSLMNVWPHLLDFFWSNTLNKNGIDCFPNYLEPHKRQNVTFA